MHIVLWRIQHKLSPWRIHRRRQRRREWRELCEQHPELARAYLEQCVQTNAAGTMGRP